ncbi:MAG TPA: hypothetical protein DCE41_08960 [Cytophagales bacterium]|nr:hypothetical protein [Cytophagales bacterium]
MIGGSLLCILVLGSARQKEYYPSGSLKSSSTTLFGMKVGRYYSYYATGQKESQAWYFFGHAQGYQHYYSRTGVQSGEGYAFLGKQQYQIEADPYGNKLHKIYDEDGQMGYMLRYQPTGEFMDSVAVEYEEGIVYEQYYSEEGVLKGRAAFRGDEKLCWLNYLEDGRQHGELFIDMEPSAKWAMDSVYYEVHHIVKVQPEDRLQLAVFLPSEDCPVYNKQLRGYLEFVAVPKALREQEGAQLFIVEYTPEGRVVMEHEISFGTALHAGPRALRARDVFLLHCFNSSAAAGA